MNTEIMQHKDSDPLDQNEEEIENRMVERPQNGFTKQHLKTQRKPPISLKMKKYGKSKIG
jgi:hypothetical protein